MLYGTKNPHGGDVYGEELRLDFSANVTPLGTPPDVVRAIQQAAELVRQYPDPYCRRLTEAIAAHEGVPERFILCGAGAAELIYSFCDALRPGLVAETAPTFSEYSLAAEHFGARTVRWELRREKGFLPDEGILDFIREARPDVLFLCTPNNPTGRTLPRSLLESVLSLCRGMDIRVMLDECFLDFTEAQSAADLLPTHENLIILKALTKNYALAGVRCGYCLTADGELLKKMSAAVQPWNVSLLAQAAGEAALRQTDFLKKNREIIPRERELLENGLRSFGFWVCPSEANYLLFRAPETLGHDLREREKIAVRSCSNYPGLGPGWYRTAVRLRNENASLLEAVRRVLED